jgi:hypothetical protein
LVTGADVQDRDGARSLLCVLRHRFTWLRCIWADGAYTGLKWLYSSGHTEIRAIVTLERCVR